MTSPASAAIVQPRKGRELRAFGDVLAVMLAGAETNQTLAVMFDTTPPRGGPPPHVHSRKDELFLVVEGRVSFLVDGAFARCADESARAGGPDMERIVGFARDQGIEFLQGERGSPTDTA